MHKIDNLPVSIYPISSYNKTNYTVINFVFRGLFTNGLPHKDFINSLINVNSVKTFLVDRKEDKLLLEKGLDYYISYISKLVRYVIEDELNKNEKLSICFTLNSFGFYIGNKISELLLNPINILDDKITIDKIIGIAPIINPEKVLKNNPSISGDIRNINFPNFSEIFAKKVLLLLGSNDLYHNKKDLDIFKGDNTEIIILKGVNHLDTTKSSLKNIKYFLGN